jgi:hypothetical protein
VRAAEADPVALLDKTDALHGWLRHPLERR